MAFPRGAIGYPCCLMPQETLPSHGSFFKRKQTIGDNHVSLSTTKLSSELSSPPSSHRRESSISSLTGELRSNLRRRSASLRSRRPKSPSPDNLAYLNPHDKRSASSTSVPTLTISTFPERNKSLGSIVSPDGDRHKTPLSAPESRAQRSGLPFSQGLKREDAQASNPTPQSAPGEIPSSSSFPPPSSGTSHPSILYNHIHEVAAKRISTLDYLRKTHEGRVYWFNTLFFNKSDLMKLPYFELQKLGRRATNYLCLGISIPAILDPNSHVLLDYLRAFNALLVEFESYQNMHSPDGSSSSFSRNKIPQMFKRNNNVPKVRRGSGADTMALQHNDGDSARSASGGAQSAYGSFAGNFQELLPGEEYSFLLTPSLPFDPDYFETFATLCDVLIDCYTKVIGLISSPDVCNSTIGDLFSKADARVRKILVTGVAKDFEDASRQGVRTEIAGIKKVVLGGLM